MKTSKGRPLKELAEAARREKLATLHPKNVRLYLSVPNSLFRWLTLDEQIKNNPVAALAMPAVPLERSRRPFTVLELNRLFSSGPYGKSGTERGWKFWLPLIGLYQGMRLVEIVGLEQTDIEWRDGVVIIWVRPNATRGLKTRQSSRIVPVHPVLAKIGFLAFAENVAVKGSLFRDLPGDSMTAVNAAQKSLSYWFREAFPEDKALVFHSLRHIWTDALCNAYVARDIAEKPGGWKSGGSAFSGYGDGHKPSILAAEIEKISYEGLDLIQLIK